MVIREEWPDDVGAKEAVFLYTHWGGSGLPEVVRAALAKRWRWDDHTYLARIVFEQMLSGYPETETGFGISTRLTDNEYDLIVLKDRRVYRVPESAFAARGFAALHEDESVSFEDYIAAAERTWENLTDDEA